MNRHQKRRMAAIARNANHDLREFADELGDVEAAHGHSKADLEAALREYRDESALILMPGAMDAPGDAPGLLTFVRPLVEKGWSDRSPEVNLLALCEDGKAYQIGATDGFTLDDIGRLVPPILGRLNANRFVAITEVWVSGMAGVNPWEADDRFEAVVIRAFALERDQTFSDAAGCYRIKRDAEGNGTLGAWEGWRP